MLLFSQEVVSSSGQTQSVAGYDVSWTVGEPFIETFTAGSNILTQGFHQTKLTVTPVTELDYPGLDFKVFPNPTSDVVTVQFNKFTENIGFSLFDNSGKKLLAKQMESTITNVDLKNYTSGQYYLKVTKNPGLTIQTFKIIKK
jgi:hypothetical protein